MEGEGGNVGIVLEESTVARVLKQMDKMMAWHARVSGSWWVLQVELVLQVAAPSHPAHSDCPDQLILFFWLAVCVIFEVVQSQFRKRDDDQ